MKLKGTIKLNISVIKHISATKTKIRFAVIDSGIGIHEKNKSKIYWWQEKWRRILLE